MSKADVDREEYIQARRAARREVAIAKKGKEIAVKMMENERAGHIFKVAKQIASDRQAVCGVNCLRNAEGSLVVDECGIKSTWKQYMEKLMNEENEWDNDISSVRREGPACRISEGEVRRALSQMKGGKATGPSEVGTELIRSVEGLSVEWLTDLFNDIVREVVFPRIGKAVSWFLCIKVKVILWSVDHTGESNCWSTL